MAGVSFDLDKMFEQSKAVGRPLLDTETPPNWFHAKQHEAWKSEERNVVVVAGTQGGKTALQAPWLLREIQRCAPLIKELGRGVALYISPTLKLLRKQAIPALRVLMEEQLQLGKFYESPEMKFQFSEEGCRRLLGFATDLVILFAYAEDSSNLESVTAVCAVWDEAGQKENKLASLEALERRLTIAQSKSKQHGRQMGRILWGSTPYEWNFFKTHVHDPAFAKKPGYELFNFPTWMNPMMDKDVIEERLKMMPIERWQMMYMGLFTQPMGKVYDCWDDDFNVCEPFEIPKWWRRAVGVDFGMVNFAAVFLAEEQKDYSKRSEPTGRWIAYKTYHGSGDDAAPSQSHSGTMEEHIKRILDMAGGEQRPYSRGGSHQESGWRDAARLAGLSIVEPAENSLDVGIANVYAWIKSRNLVVFSTLTKLRDEISSYSWDLDELEQVKATIKDKARYHRLDCLRYISFMCYRGAKKLAGTKALSRYGSKGQRSV